MAPADALTETRRTHCSGSVSTCICAASRRSHSADRRWSRVSRAFQPRRERVRHSEHAEEVDLEVSFDDVRIAQVVVNRDPGVVDEDVEAVDSLDCPVDLRSVGHIEREGRDAAVGNAKRAAASGKHPLRASSEGLVDERAADPAVRAVIRTVVFATSIPVWFG